MLIKIVRENYSTLSEKQKKKRLFLISLITYILIFEIKNYYNYSNIKVCLCSIGKKENKYAREYVEHYLKYGVDKIFLYDNNDIDDEKLDTLLSDYINNKYVEIINLRGKKGLQMESMNDCYKNHLTEYNWFIFYDMDEFIHLKNIKNIKYYLSKSHFNKCQVIHLNWVIHSDNDLLYYDNRSLKERFPKRAKSFNYSIDIKSMIRGNILTNITSIHYLNPKLITCDGFGKIKKKKKFFK